MRRFSRSGRACRRGAVVIEFAWVLPVMLIFLLGIWEVGRLSEVQQILWNAAREGARQASTGEVNAETIKANVLVYIKNAEPRITNTEGYDLIYTNLTDATRSDPTTSSQLDRYKVTVKLPFNNVRWAVLDQITNITELTATVDWMNMRDRPIDPDFVLPVD
jgi:Flp pilus assembly protein TadG